MLDARMDFTFSPEQEALRDAVRTTLANEAPSTYVRRMMEDDPRDGDGWVLDGVKPLVLAGHTADWAIVVAREADAGGALAAFLVDGPAGELVPGLDVTRKIARLAFDARPARRLGPAGDQRA